MISDMDVFKVLDAMARHAVETQRVSAVNVSRAAEPGYKAMEVESFDAFMARAKQAAGSDGLAQPFRTFEMNTPSAPNGNSVSVEQELYKSAEATGQHTLAVTTYAKTLDLMRMAISGRR
ncbi:MAG: flagellar biosynthesis protein FlgB [Pseudomonadota bacterium]